MNDTEIGLTAEQLAEKFPDRDWQNRYVQIMDILDLLHECVIGHDYTIPDAMSEAIHLTEEGGKLFDKLVRKEKINPKEARLIVALTVGHRELFIDVLATDLEALIESVSRQIRDKRIRLPFVHGRLLYDSFAELFPTEKDSLSVAETLELLDSLPIGVFQHGSLVSGPFGLLRSATVRNIPASRRVPAFHCEQTTCDVVHGAQLSTSQEAAINASRDRARKVLEAEPDQASAWGHFARLAAGFEASFFADTRSGSVTPLLADCLSDGELRALFCGLLDGYRGELRKAVQPIIGGGNSALLAGGLDRAELLQLTFLAEEKDIANELDRLVVEGIIRVPEGEVRRPRMAGRVRTGAFRLTAELGAHGHRQASSDPGFASLRLRKLLDELYDVADPSQRDELGWQLRSVESGQLTEQLETYFRTTNPRTVIEQLVFARRSNVETVARTLEIQNYANRQDAELVTTILWKLGFPVIAERDPHEKFWSLYAKTTGLTESLRVSGIGDSEEFRGTASVFFAELEGVLQTSLGFACWALLNDHPASSSPFTYDRESDYKEGIVFINQVFNERSNEAESLFIDPERPELYALLRGFATLASHLESLLTSEGHLRNEADFPDYYGKTRLKDFAFLRTIPFLNLLPNAQQRLIHGINEIGTSLIAADVNDVRNHYAHYRRLSPDIERMSRALDAIRKAVELIEGLGLCPAIYLPDGRETDRWGRTQVHMVGPMDRGAIFALPTRFDWMGLPSFGQAQHLVRSAIFAEPNEMLRFEPRFSSEYTEYWSNIPNRRVKKASLDARENTSGDHTSTAGLVQ